MWCPGKQGLCYQHHIFRPDLLFDTLDQVVYRNRGRVEVVQIRIVGQKINLAVLSRETERTEKDKNQVVLAGHSTQPFVSQGLKNGVAGSGGISKFEHRLFLERSFLDK